MPVTFYSAEEYEALAERTLRLQRQLETVESLRPVWAQGWTSDSEAAQASTNALQQLWTLLGAANQTEAVLILKKWKSERK